MYEQDSFFDLTPLGQAGLVVISATLFVLMLLAARRGFRWRSVWLRFVGALVLFWLFVWISPQVYYTYYLTLFEGLPIQWVIWPPASPVEAFGLLFFQGPQNLSAHSQGLLGWSLLAISLIKPGGSPRDRQRE
ncbi:MAG: hypothetical protein AAGC81_11325 [Pseudomonadota bacterium]